MEIRYLTGEEVLVLHSEIIDETGGLHGIRDPELLISIIQKPKASFGGKELYKGVFRKAAVYLEALAHYQVFLDGNKRTAFATASRFLFLNGYNFTATNKETENFILRVAIKKLDLNTIATWLERHSRKIKT